VKKVIVGAVFAAGVGIAGLAGAAPALAQGPTVDCSGGCVNRSAIAADPPTGAPWTDFFAAVAPWEKIFDPAGDGNGVWETGVQAVNGGAWEKVFPPAPE
jgi:hypothetical protein